MTSSASVAGSVAVPSPNSFTSNPPSVGDLVYLASYIFRVNATAVTTMPDTPNQFSAQFQIMGDEGNLDLNNLVGAQGQAGTANFVLRDMTDAIIVNNVFELPELQDTYEDVGLYWRLDTLDQYGYVIMETAYVWYGNGWRAFMMGTFGPPGPIPSVLPTCITIDPSEQSYVLPTGPTFQPTWQFNLAVPQGAWGPITPVAFFPDVEEVAINNLNVLAATGFLESGNVLWQPLGVDLGLLAPYSMPEVSFKPFVGQSQQAFIGEIVLPQQPWDWTPVVWGHIGSIGGQGEGGLLVIVVSIINELREILNGGLSAGPLQVGCEVLLGNQTTGTMVARGFGNLTGVVNVYPHYSTPQNMASSITPINEAAVVRANHTDPAQGTLYVNLWNDGVGGNYYFDEHDCQMFVSVVPIQPKYASISGIPRAPQLGSVGTLTADTAVIGEGGAMVNITGTGILSTQIGIIGG